jgi:nucleoside-diphosphate-sugar epimerase
MSKVIISGGLGFIFSHVTEYLVSKGYEVIVIDNCSEGSHREIVNGSFRFYEVDMATPHAKDIIELEDPEYIIHAAAHSDVDGSIKNPIKVINNNFDSTLNVFEAVRKCKNLKKLVYVSSDEVYGECEHRKKEDEILFPKNPYSVSKAFGSLLRLTYDNTYPELKDKTAETRFCNVFGERQDDRKIMPLIKESIELGKVIPVHNGGKGYREYLYVKNIPEAVELVMLRGDRTYNITLNDGFTVEELIKSVEDITKKNVITYESNRQGMDLKYQMDNSRILKLGWKPKWSFRQGIKEYLK